MEIKNALFMKPGLVRITRNPETFIFPFMSKKGKTFWRLVTVRNVSLGVFGTEAEAKEAGIQYARRFLKAPKDYRERYEAKLQTYEQLRKEQNAQNTTIFKKRILWDD